MNVRSLDRIALTVLVALVTPVITLSAERPGLTNDDIATPSLINYQGRLTDEGGMPINGVRDMAFAIFAAANGATPVWAETAAAVPVNAGLFNVVLGSVRPIVNLPDGPDCYLGITVDGVALAPRVRLVSVPYSLKSDNADRLDDLHATAFALAGHSHNYVQDVTASPPLSSSGGSTPNIALNTSMAGDLSGSYPSPAIAQKGAAVGQVLKWTGAAWQPRNDSTGSSDNAWVRASPSDSVLYTAGFLGLAKGGATNALYGNLRHTHVNFGSQCTTGTAGLNYWYCTVGGGLRNCASGDRSTVSGGGLNAASGQSAAVGGGDGNLASANYASVGGGQNNRAQGGQGATVAGGMSNAAVASTATVGGGYWNLAGASAATVGGGSEDTASGACSVVGGGQHNLATASLSTIGGGTDNRITITGMYATIGGGLYNTIDAGDATIGGGQANSASGADACVAGGTNNQAQGYYSTVAGGRFNTAQGSNSAIAGGCFNNASDYAVVAGGDSNSASGMRSAVIGGRADTAAGDYSLAAGRRVRVTAAADSTFAFGTNFTTSTPSAVIFCHGDGSGTRLGVGVANPQYPVQVNGGAYCTGSQWVSASSAALKRNIRVLTRADCQELLGELVGTNVVFFQYKSEGTGEEHVGLVAEDAPELIATPTRDGVATGDAVGYLFAALKAEHEQCADLAKRVAELEARLR